MFQDSFSQVCLSDSILSMNVDGIFEEAPEACDPPLGNVQEMAAFIFASPEPSNDDLSLKLEGDEEDKPPTLIPSSAEEMEEDDDQEQPPESSLVNFLRKSTAPRVVSMCSSSRNMLSSQVKDSHFDLAPNAIFDDFIISSSQEASKSASSSSLSPPIQSLQFDAKRFLRSFRDQLLDDDSETSALTSATTEPEASTKMDVRERLGRFGDCMSYSEQSQEALMEWFKYGMKGPSVNPGVKHGLKRAHLLTSKSREQLRRTMSGRRPTTLRSQHSILAIRRERRASQQQQSEGL